MAPALSSPPRPVRNKRPAISSPPINPTGYNRDQSEIALSWWAKKKEKVASLHAKVSELRGRVHILEQEAREANEVIERLEEELEEERKGREENAEKLIDVINSHGGFEKIESADGRALAIGALLVSYLTVIMRKTQVVTRLHAICDALFNKVIFGVEATATVLGEIYTKHINEQHMLTFLPWKILRAIDLSIAGSLNYNGVETLRLVENLVRYERGIIPSWSQIQRAAYELHDLGQEIIPFEKKQSALGEMFAYDYERFKRYILKTFQ
jgi:hypothetical protein